VTPHNELDGLAYLLGNLIAKYANVLEITEPPDTGQVIPFAPKKSTHDIPIENDKAARYNNRVSIV